MFTPVAMMTGLALFLTGSTGFFLPIGTQQSISRTPRTGSTRARLRAAVLDDRHLSLGLPVSPSDDQFDDLGLPMSSRSDDQFAKISVRSPQPADGRLHHLRDTRFNASHWISQARLAGFDLPQLQGMVARHPPLISENLASKMEKLVAAGFEREHVIKMATEFPQVLGYDVESRLGYDVEMLEDAGFERKDVMDMAARYPPLLWLDVESRLEKLEDAGFERKDVIKMATKFPQVLGYDVESRLGYDVEKLEDAGFERKAVMKMAARYPPLLWLGVESRLEKLEDAGFERKDVIKMAIEFPQVLGYDVEPKRLQRLVRRTEKTPIVSI